MPDEVQIEYTAVDKTKAAVRSVNAGMTSVAGAAKKLQATTSAAFGFLLGPGGLIALLGGAGIGLFASDVRQAAESVDALAKSSQRLGVGIEPLQELRFAARQSGIEMNVLELGIQRFGRRIGEVAEGTGELRSGLEILERRGLGVELFDDTGETLRETTDILEDFLDALVQIEDVQVRNAVAMKAFDSEGLRLVQLAGDGAGALRRMREEAREMGVVLDERLVLDTEKVNNRLDVLGAVLDANTARIKLAFLPAIVSLSEGLAKASDALGESFRSAEDFSNVDLPDLQIEIGTPRFSDTAQAEMEAELDRAEAAFQRALRERDFALRLTEQGGGVGIDISALESEVQQALTRLQAAQLSTELRVDVDLSRFEEVEAELERQVDDLEARRLLLQIVPTFTPGSFEIIQRELAGVDKEIQKGTAALDRLRDLRQKLVDESQAQAIKFVEERELENLQTLGIIATDAGSAIEVTGAASEKAQAQIRKLDRQMEILGETSESARQQLQLGFQFSDQVRALAVEVGGLGEAVKESLTEGAEGGLVSFKRALDQAVAAEQAASRQIAIETAARRIDVINQNQNLSAESQAAALASVQAQLIRSFERSGEASASAFLKPFLDAYDVWAAAAGMRGAGRRTRRHERPATSSPRSSSRASSSRSTCGRETPPSRRSSRSSARSFPTPSRSR